VGAAGFGQSLAEGAWGQWGRPARSLGSWRGPKEKRTPIIPMNKIYYNFIRPHQGLEGKTPAEAAGIGIDGENKWEELLKRSIKRLKL
jgi:hypothetical protein